MRHDLSGPKTGGRTPSTGESAFEIETHVVLSLKLLLCNLEAVCVCISYDLGGRQVSGFRRVSGDSPQGETRKKQTAQNLDLLKEPGNINFQKGIEP